MEGGFKYTRVQEGLRKVNRGVSRAVTEKKLAVVIVCQIWLGLKPQSGCCSTAERVCSLKNMKQKAIASVWRKEP